MDPSTPAAIARQRLGRIERMLTDHLEDHTQHELRRRRN